MEFLPSFVNALPPFTTASFRILRCLPYTRAQDSRRRYLSQKLLKSTAITGGMTLISRVAGLVRDIVFANFMGAKSAGDAFRRMGKVVIVENTRHKSLLGERYGDS